MARSKYHIFHSTFIDQLSEKIELMLCLAFSYIFLCNLINQLHEKIEIRHCRAYLESILCTYPGNFNLWTNEKKHILRIISFYEICMIQQGICCANVYCYYCIFSFYFVLFSFFFCWCLFKMTYFLSFYLICCLHQCLHFCF